MKRVYYLTSEKYALCDLKHQHIKVARFNDLNDPFELIDAELSDPDVRKRFRRWKREVNAKYGLICFSAMWHNPVLWSHYADKHRGLCLGFDVPESELHEVTYLDRRRRLTDLVPETARPGSLLCTKDSDRNKVANCTWRGARSYGKARSTRGKVILVSVLSSGTGSTKTNTAASSISVRPAVRRTFNSGHSGQIWCYARSSPGRAAKSLTSS